MIFWYHFFLKSEPLNLSDFKMKLTEELKILLFWLSSNLGLP